MDDLDFVDAMLATEDEDIFERYYEDEVLWLGEINEDG